MTTHGFTSTSRRAISALALLLTLTFGALATVATAQPSMPDDAFNRALAEMEDHLVNPDVRAKLTQAQWATYGDNLENALASGHDGVRQGALRMIILYGADLAISRKGVHDLVRIYRDHEDDRLRRMAVVALGATQDAWGIDFLKRSARFEKSPSVRHSIQAVLMASGAVDLGPARVGS